MSSTVSSLVGELGEIFDQICLFSEMMRNCDSSFIRQLHREIETDENYKEFRVAVIASCLTNILNEEDSTEEYIKYLDEERDKMRLIVANAIGKFNSEDDFWDNVKNQNTEDDFSETLEAFYFEHFLTAQRFLLCSYLAKRQGDNAYAHQCSKKL